VKGCKIYAYARRSGPLSREGSSSGVIRKVDKPTDWVNSLEMIEKTTSLSRHKGIKREHFQLPTIEDITTAWDKNLSGVE
jgi:hypothetical protein